MKAPVLGAFSFPVYNNCMSTVDDVKKDLQKVGTKKRAEAALWFFKTGPGEYGEGDKFIGVTVPDQRKVAKKHPDLSLTAVQTLLNSPIHEHRLTALFILVAQFKKADEKMRKKIVDLYLKNYARVNNWDLVDSSAHYIIGQYLRDKPRNILYTLARSNNLWKKRIAVISTFWFIKDDDFDDALKIAEILRDDEHDLIHKAVGWMLREVGNRNQVAEEKFLKKHYKKMPRTMLRYAIEKFDKSKKDLYMKK